MSQIIIRESIDLNTTSSYNEQNMLKLRDDMNIHANKMIWSKAPWDRRYINIYRVRKVNFARSRFGLSGLERHKSMIIKKAAKKKPKSRTRIRESLIT